MDTTATQQQEQKYNMAPEPVYKLRCSCNQYPWGKQGKQSLSAQLCAKTPGWDDPSGGTKPATDFKIDDGKMYSEMWMGTYPVLPSYVADSGEDLQDVLDRHPQELIGDQTLKKFGHSKLPYLPKVLSISKALPLQIHPNKEKSAELHRKDPNSFTDPNHKPEIALALGPFEAFCGFKPLADIGKLMELEPLQKYLPQSKPSSFDDKALKHVVHSMLTDSDANVKKAVQSLKSQPAEKFGQDTHIQKLIPRLEDQYDETDPGILVALITMNYLTLDTGDSIYIPADGIHAYLSGDIIECMARSNNVLNTGFCPRAERNSADLFCECLTFTPHSAKECMLPAKPYEKSKNGKTQVYAPPMSEFNALQTELKAGENETLGAVGGPSVFIATKGSANLKAGGKSYEVEEGNVFFVAQGKEMELESQDGLLMHTFYVE